MKNALLVDIQMGLQWLAEIEPSDGAIKAYQSQLHELAQAIYQNKNVFAWMAVIQALKAANQGNFGVGAVIVDAKGVLQTYDHNHVLVPHFRSDQHAEMVVLNQFEDARHSKAPPRDYVLYTSLEPCVMCLGRIIFSRIRETYFVSKDPSGGVMDVNHLPFLMKDFAKQQVIAELDCDSTLKALSTAIHAHTLDQAVALLGDV